MHENHRNRVRERFLKDGLEGFEPHEALELLLFYAIPRRDTHALAQNLLNRFGSLPAVLDATAEELAGVQGMGRHTASLLCLMKPFWRYCRQESARRGPCLPDCQAACRYAPCLFEGRSVETLFLLCLDGSCRLIRPVMLHEGAVDAVSVHPREAVEAAIRNGASQVILAHNHPSGPPSPSASDIECTKRLSAAFRSIGIVMMDHIIVGEGDSVCSFSAEGRLPCEGPC